VNRPQHSPEAFRRYVQMSATRVFVLVEGRNTDVFFYSAISRPVCEALGLEYEIVRANRVCGSGGKQSLLELYQYLASANSLTEQSEHPHSWCFFYLDKDVDDIFGRIVSSPHVVYTPCYTVENALFMYGDLIRAMAAASSLEPARIERRIPDKIAWAREKATAWREFIALCIFSQKHDIHTDCTYSCNSSPLHETGAETFADGLQARKLELQQRAGLTGGQFERKFRAVIRLIDRIYRKNQHDSVFNDKWYVPLLMKEIDLAAAGDHFSAHALSNGLSAALRATLDFTEEWTEHFRTPLRELVS
jgi:hypothetical protein